MDLLFTFKSALKQYMYPVTGVNIGVLPDWIKGSLYRNGPGKFEVGSDKYSHSFDGLAMVQRYYINDGKVTFQSQYIQSKSYLRNMAANRIVVSEFGTTAYPDPCRSIFNRLSNFFENEMTDNTSVCVFPVGDELFTSTETDVIHRIDPVDLTTIGSGGGGYQLYSCIATVRFPNIVTVNRATAHNHIDKETGLVHFLGFANYPVPSYAFFTIPPIKKEDSSRLNEKYDMEKLLTGAKIVGKINARWKLNPSYYHSFGITENYYIHLECPLTISIVDMMKTKIWGSSIAEAFKWWPQEKTIIHVMDRNSGELLSHVYVTDPLFTFHHINAYEDKGHIVIDYCGYDNGYVVMNLFVDSLKDKFPKSAPSSPRRLIVPLKFDEKSACDINLISLPNTNCTANIVENRNDKCVVHCHHEELSDNAFMELPTINYNAYNGKKYRYLYGVAENMLKKVDTETKTSIVWCNEEPGYACESIFVKHPNADDNNPGDEDYGVLLTPILVRDKTVDTERYQSLVFIDAKSMKEICRTEFRSVSIPLSFHGVFQPINSLG